jgi:hypothetical protein
MRRINHRGTEKKGYDPQITQMTQIKKQAGVLAFIICDIRAICRHPLYGFSLCLGASVVKNDAKNHKQIMADL